MVADFRGRDGASESPLFALLHVIPQTMGRVCGELVAGVLDHAVTTHRHRNAAEFIEVSVELGDVPARVDEVVAFVALQ